MVAPVKVGLWLPLLGLASCWNKGNNNNQQEQEAANYDQHDQYEVDYDQFDDVHPQLSPNDLCGSWTEYGSCHTKQCDVSKWSRTSTMFSNRPMQGTLKPHDPHEAHWEWYDYKDTTTEFDGDFCDHPNHEVFSMAVLGEFAIPPDMEVAGWTEMEQLPHTYKFAIGEKYDPSYIQQWPTRICENALSFLNRECPCGGEWHPGTNRTVTMDYGPDAPNAGYCREWDQNCHVCHPDNCPGFFNLRIFGNVQMDSHDHIQFSRTYAAHDSHPKEGFADTTVEHSMHRNMADGAGGYDGCKNFIIVVPGGDVYPYSAEDDHHEAEVQAHQHYDAKHQKAPDVEEEEEVEHQQQKVHFENENHHHHETQTKYHVEPHVQAQSVEVTGVLGDSVANSKPTSRHMVLKRQTSTATRAVS